MNLRKKIFLITLFVYVPVIAFFGMFAYGITEKEIVNSKLEHLDTIATLQESRINEAIEKNFERLQGVSSRTQLRLSLDNYNSNPNPDDLNKIEKIINDARSSVADFTDIMILNVEGKTVASTSWEYQKNSSYNKIFQNGLNSQNLEIDLESLSGPNIFLSGPLYLDEKLIGSVVIVTDLESIVGIIEDYSSLGNTGESFMAKYDDQGRALLITPLRFDPNAINSRTTFSEEYNLPMTHALQKHEGTFTDTVDYRGEPVLSATRHIESVNWGLVVKIDTSEAFAPLDNLKIITIAAMILLVCISVLASIALASRFVSPLKELKIAAKTISEGNYDVRISENKDELGELSKEFIAMAKSLKKSRKELIHQKEIERMKQEFLTMISHELKTPLTPLTMWIDLLREPGVLGVINSDQREAVDKISNSSVQLKKLINDMFDACKLDLNQLHFNYDEFNVKDMMEEIHKNFKMNDKGIQLFNNVKENIFVNSDKDRITQVIQNFINNALDFVDPDKGVIRMEAIDKGTTVKISVKDNGIGISDEDQKKLFTKFYQKDSSMTREYGGSGLGLAVSKGIITGLGGKIGVKSIQNQGSEFYFEISKRKIPDQVAA